MNCQYDMLHLLGYEGASSFSDVHVTSSLESYWILASTYSYSSGKSKHTAACGPVPRQQRQNKQLYNGRY
jgi:hypothetical protein